MSWTQRGNLTEGDKALIRGIIDADKSKAAAQIFITGECHITTLDTKAAKSLFRCNEAVDDNPISQDPLFIQTKRETTRMTRFNPPEVWGCVEEKTLKELFDTERQRLGAHYYIVDELDFYESLISSIKKREGAQLLFPVIQKPNNHDEFYQAMYLSCLILYGKPDYMAVPVSEHFASPDAAEYMKTVKFRKLSDIEEQKYHYIFDERKSIKLITNPELNFLLSVYESAVK